MDPPLLKFVTKVYHPNIDSNTGLICLDVLKMPPHGKWRPTHKISSILTAIQQLLSDPNPYDPLDAEIVTKQILCLIFFGYFMISLLNRLRSTSPINHCSWRMPRSGPNFMLWHEKKDKIFLF